MQVAARLYATLFEVFFPCQRWRIMLGVGILSPVEGFYEQNPKNFRADTRWCRV